MKSGIFLSGKELMALFVIVFLLIFLIVTNVETNKKINPIKRVIALTFDDGPSDKTLEILDILKRQNVKATFFVVGKFAAEKPEILKQEIADGEEIENHSYDHSKFLAELPAKDLLDNVNKTTDIVEKITGEKTKFFRPPYGNINANMQKTLEDAGYKIVKWDVDPRDWDAQNNPKNIEKYVFNYTLDKSVILFHDGKSVYEGSESKQITDENTEKILEDLIIKFKEYGFEFVTLSDLYK